jgi:coenzyme F420-reducing hydrogenase delta subunit
MNERLNEGLDSLVEELETAAERLRSEQIAPAEAAELVERCAELAARVGSELDAASRAASEPEGQERLL